MEAFHFFCITNFANQAPPQISKHWFFLCCCINFFRKSFRVMLRQSAVQLPLLRNSYCFHWLQQPDIDPWSESVVHASTQRLPLSPGTQGNWVVLCGSSIVFSHTTTSILQLYGKLVFSWYCHFQQHRGKKHSTVFYTMFFLVSSIFPMHSHSLQKNTDILPWFHPLLDVPLQVFRLPQLSPKYTTKSASSSGDCS